MISGEGCGVEVMAYGEAGEGATVGMVGISSKVPLGRGGSASSLLRDASLRRGTDVIVVVVVGGVVLAVSFRKMRESCSIWVLRQGCWMGLSGLRRIRLYTSEEGSLSLFVSIRAKERSE